MVLIFSTKFIQKVQITNRSAWYLSSYLVSSIYRTVFRYEYVIATYQNSVSRVNRMFTLDSIKLRWHPLGSTYIRPHWLMWRLQPLHEPRQLSYPTLILALVIPSSWGWSPIVLLNLITFLLRSLWSALVVRTCYLYIVNFNCGIWYIGILCHLSLCPKLVSKFREK